MAHPLVENQRALQITLHGVLHRTRPPKTRKIAVYGHGGHSFKAWARHIPKTCRKNTQPGRLLQNNAESPAKDADVEVDAWARPSLCQMSGVPALNNDSQRYNVVSPNMPGRQSYGSFRGSLLT